MLLCYCTQTMSILYKQLNKSHPKRWEPLKNSNPIFVFATNIIKIHVRKSYKVKQNKKVNIKASL